MENIGMKQKHSDLMVNGFVVQTFHLIQDQFIRR